MEKSSSTEGAKPVPATRTDKLETLRVFCETDPESAANRFLKRGI